MTRRSAARYGGANRFSSAVIGRSKAKPMMSAQVFLTKPRGKMDVDGTDLGRYSRLEHGTPDSAWIVSDSGEGGHRKALDRWLRGDDGALEGWLGGPPPGRPRKAKAPA